MPTLAAVLVPVRADLASFPGQVQAGLTNAFRASGPKVQQEAKKQGGILGTLLGSGIGNAVGSNFGPMLSGISNQIGSFAGEALGPLSAVGAGFGLLAGQAVSMGVRTAASMEQAQIGFETLLGSGQKAQTFLNNLEKFAAATPFELPGLVESARTLLGVGLDADQTMAALQAFGNASSAVGVGQENFQRIMIATSQAIGAGRFQTEDLNQITENGIPIWTILSRAMGKPVPVLRQLASAGKLMTADVLPTLEKQMNRDYGGAMARQSRSLSGEWSTFMDTLNIGMSQVLTPLIPMMTSGLTVAINVTAAALNNIPGPALAAVAGFVGIGGAIILTNKAVGQYQQIAKTVTAVTEALAARTTAAAAAATGEAVATNAAATGTSRLGAAATTAGNAVGVLAARLVIIGSVIGIAYAANQVADAFGRWEVSKQNANDLADALTHLQGSAKAGAAASDLLEVGMQKYFGTVRTGSDVVNQFAGIARGAFGDGILDVAGRVQSLGERTSRFNEVAGQMDTALARMVGSGHLTDAAKFLDQVRVASGLSDAEFVHVTNHLPQYTAAMAAANAATAKAAAAHQASAGAVQRNAAAQMAANAAQARAAAVADGTARGLGGIAANATKAAGALARSAVEANAHVRSTGQIAGAASAAAAAIARQGIAADRASASTRDIVRNSRDATEAYTGSAGAANRANSAHTAFGAALGRAAAGVVAEAGALARSTATAQLNTDAVKANQKWLESWGRSLHNVTNAFLGSEAAADGYRSSILAVSESIKQNGRTLSQNTQAGLANRAAVRSMVQAGQESIQNMIDQQRGGVAIRAEWVRQRNQLFNVMRQLGLNKGAALDYVNNALGRVPPRVATQVTTPGLPAARSGIQGLAGDINRLSSRDLQIALRSTGDLPTRLQIYSRLKGMALGGPVSGPGGPREDRAGLFALSNGEYVVNAAGAAANRPILDAINFGNAKLSGLVTGMARGGPVNRHVTDTARRTGTWAPRGALPAWVNDVEQSIVQMMQVVASASSGGPIPGGSGVARWGPMVRRMLDVVGLSPSLYDNFLRQIQTESGGNPNAIQGDIGDINNATGDLAKGLLQVIGATFRAYHWPGTSWSVFDPWANMTAAGNYVKHRYPNPEAVIGHGHGYDGGGWLPPGGIGMNLTGRPERVLDPQQSAAYSAGGGAGNVRVMVMLDGSVIDDRVHVLVEDAVGELGARIDNGIGG